jgi:ribosomal protein S18 acetylase RimI-like enzyme
MIVRPITADELELFANLSKQPTSKNSSSLQKLAHELWEKGSSHPQWFFLAEENGQPLGRAAYWRLKARPEEMRLIALQLPWDDRYLEVGLQLLLESWEQLKASRGQYVLRQLVSFWDYLDEQREVLEHAGMTLLQEKQSYLWSPRGPVEVPERLNFRSVAQAGEPAFVEAIRRVTIGVMDREIQAMGGEEAAQQLFEILKEDNIFKEEWAQLGYDSQGKLVGLVAPVGMPDAKGEGSIGYIGVTSEQRGRGYIHDLLAKGMSVLLTAGFKTVYAETDNENAAVRHALELAGYRPYCQLWLYRGKL